MEQLIPICKNCMKLLFRGARKVSGISVQLVNTARVNEIEIRKETTTLIDEFGMLSKMRTENVLCDVVLKVGERSISAHRVVLAATIPYFSAMFKIDTIESRQKEITMVDIEPDTLEALIDHAYNEGLHINKENVQSLMEGASYLQMTGVFNGCVAFITKWLEPDNVLGIRKFAEELHCEYLVKAAQNYIDENCDEVVLSKEFLQLNFDEIDAFVKRENSFIISQKLLYKVCMKWVLYSKIDRVPLLPKILVRLPLYLRPKLFLTERVAKHKLISSSAECCEILHRAMEYKSLSERYGLLLDRMNHSL